MRRRAAPFAVLVSLLLVATVVGATTLRVTYAPPSGAGIRAFDAPGSAVADFNGDGWNELVAHNENGRVYVLRTYDMYEYAVLSPPYPSGWGARAISDPAVADVDGDGALEVIVVTSAATVCSFEFVRWTGSVFEFSRQWCTRGTTYDGGVASADGGPWVEDVTGDGRAEIFFQTEQRGLFALRPDGSILWSRGDYGGNAGPTVADLDGDGRKEALFFSDGGRVTAVHAATGTVRWTFHARNYVYPAAIPVSGAVGDLDRDGRQEVVFLAREATDTSNYQNNDFGLFVLNSNGGLRWWRHPGWGQPLSYTHPIVADVTGDGVPEILAQDWNTIGHKPGNWEQLGPANVFAYTASGALLWRTSIRNDWSNDDLGLADLDADGALEVLAVGRSSAGDGVYVLDARTGAVERHVTAAGWQVLRGPTVTTFHGGTLSWALPVVRSGVGGFHIFEENVACRVVYGGWPNREACSPPVGGEPGPSTFSASFSNVRGNTWWVESDVSANEPLAGVDARVNGGGWIALTKQSWGSWAKSIPAPAGSVVEFRARSADGDAVVSARYTWPP